MISSILLVISPLFTLMMFLSTPNPLTNIGNICIRSLIPSNAMTLLSLLRKSSYFKQRPISLAMTFLKDKFVPLTEPFSLLISFPMLLLIKHNYKYSLGPNYIVDFYKDLRKQCKPLFDQLQNNPLPWTDVHTSLVKQIKSHVKTLPCLGIPTINAFKIVEIDAFDITYGDSLKQRVSPGLSK